MSMSISFMQCQGFGLSLRQQRFETCSSSTTNNGKSTTNNGKRFHVCHIPSKTVSLPLVLCKCEHDVDVDKLKRRIIRKGFQPTPKLIYRLRKKEIQKIKRKAKKDPNLDPPPRLKKLIDEQQFFKAASENLETIMNEAGLLNTYGKVPEVAGESFQKMPWHRAQSDTFKNKKQRERETFFRRKESDGRHVELQEFRRMIAKRGNCENEVDPKNLHWLLDDDFEAQDYPLKTTTNSKIDHHGKQRPPLDEEEQIKWLTERLNKTNPQMPTWQLSKLMHAGRMKFTDGRLVRIVQVLGTMGNWRKAMDVVQWVHNRRRYKVCKGRYVYTALISVLQKARRPVEALNVFCAMLEHISSYPDMAAYHSIAVTLGQTGYLKELLWVIDCLRNGSSKLLNDVKFLGWKPLLEPDVVVYNAVLNACVSCQQWEGVFWVFQEMKQHGVRPTSATYGLAMEVMLSSGKYELVHNFFERMAKAGFIPNASTYRVLVCTFAKEQKADDAVKAVEQMEHRGIVATGSVYYELACCLCRAGRWQDALTQVEKLRRFPYQKRLNVSRNVAFTGMIQSSAASGLIHDCISLFNHLQKLCCPNIGTVNAMIHAYGKQNLFNEAKDLFEGLSRGWRIGKKADGAVVRLTPDYFTYIAMLEASTLACNWEYVENVYKQMILHGHQLDQRRHSWLILAAARSGKFHLLDHVFDQLLGTGEIPNVSLFKEKIFQSLQAEDYDKVIHHVRTMDQFSVTISESDWSAFFDSNKNDISENKLFHFFSEVNSLADEKSDDTTLKNLIAYLKASLGSIELIVSNNTAKTEFFSHDNFISTMEGDKINSSQESKQESINEFSKKLVACDILESGFGETVINNLSFDVNLLLPSPSEILRGWRGIDKKTQTGTHG